MEKIEKSFHDRFDYSFKNIYLFTDFCICGFSVKYLGRWNTDMWVSDLV